MTAEFIELMDSDLPCNQLGNEEDFTPCVEFEPDSELTYERKVSVGLAKKKGRPVGSKNKAKTTEPCAQGSNQPKRQSPYDPRPVRAKRRKR